MSFSKFYNSTIYIFKQTSNSNSYSSPSGAWHFIKSVQADLQPYNGGLAQKEYGLVVECQMRIYCDKCTDITEGIGISLLDGTTKPEYTVIYVEHWDDFTTAILKRK